MEMFVNEHFDHSISQWYIITSFSNFSILHVFCLFDIEDAVYTFHFACAATELSKYFSIAFGINLKKTLLNQYFI